MIGAGIHSGQCIRLRLEPSSEGKIRFIRSDVPGFSVEANIELTKTRNCTALIWKDHSIQTIEHLMASFFLLGIDSVEVIVDGPEIPAGDGSAAPFIQLLEDSGFCKLEQSKTIYDIIRPFSIQNKTGTISVFPGTRTQLSYEIAYDHPMIGRQQYSLRGDIRNWIKEIAPARTFGFLKDVETLRKRNLACGASMENTIVLNDKRIVSGNLRFEDEFVRHKLLDLAGDFHLLNGTLNGHIQAIKAGHTLHLKAVRYLLSHPEIMKRRS